MTDPSRLVQCPRCFMKRLPYVRGMCRKCYHETKGDPSLAAIPKQVWRNPEPGEAIPQDALEAKIFGKVR